MARTRSHPHHEHIDGVPDGNQLGASKNEAYAVAMGVFILLILALAFWYQASH